MATCKDCRFSAPFGTDQILPVGQPKPLLCQRHPPDIVRFENGQVTTHFPIVNTLMWCGDFEERSPVQ